MAFTPRAVLEFESAVLRHVITGMRATFAPPKASGCTYAGTNMLGIFGTMVARPHSVEGVRVTLNRGILGRVEFSREALHALRPCTHVDRRALRRANRGAAFLLVPGCGAVEIELGDGRRIFVASDKPAELCALLRPPS